jgi:hypothetical protein
VEATPTKPSLLKKLRRVETLVDECSMFDSSRKLDAILHNLYRRRKARVADAVRHQA